MRNNKIKDSWDKIKPGSATSERMLNNILRQGHEMKIAETASMPPNFKQERKNNMTSSPYWKIFAPLAACVIIALIAAVPLFLNNTGSPGNDINDILLPVEPNAEYETNPPQGEDIADLNNLPEMTMPAPIYPIEPLHPTYELVLNEVFGQMSPGRMVAQTFWVPLSNDEIHALLPNFNGTLYASAEYLDSGALLEILIFAITNCAGAHSGQTPTDMRTWDGRTIRFYGDYDFTTIRIAPTNIVHDFVFGNTLMNTSTDDIIFSYVYGIPVAAGVFDNRYPPGDGLVGFIATFELDGMFYSINLMDEKVGERGPARLAEVVNTVIRNGPANLDILADPVVPELRHDALTLEEALSDPEFGSFLPAYIPPGLDFGDARRIISQHDSSLHVNWHESWRISISWSVNSISWHHQDSIVLAHEREKFDVNLYTIPWMDSVPREYIDYLQNPIFLAEEMTFEIVQARAIYDGRAGNLLEPMIVFSVMFDDVVVTINSSGVSTEDVWRMLEGLL